MPVNRALLLSAFLLAGSTAPAADWPQWRGPHRDGVLPSFERKTWPERLKLRWKLTVGEGHSSPVFAGGKIFVIARQNGQEVLSGIDPEAGKILWQQSYAAPYKMNPAAARHGEGPKSALRHSDVSAGRRWLAHRPYRRQ